MTETIRRAARPWNKWRIARWSVAAIMLLTPAVMMQFVDDWNWTIGDFLFAGTIIGSFGLLYEFAERPSSSRAYRVGTGIALVSSFMLVWSTLVRDDGQGMMFFEIIMAALVGGTAAQFTARGLKRTMTGVAVMQALVGLAVATEPVTAAIPGGPIRALIYSGFFTLLWLSAAAAYANAARAEG